MKPPKSIRVFALALAGVLCVALLGGCVANDTAKAEQAENLHFMTQVNLTMEDLQSRLDSFNEAVSRNDLVGMRTQADNAFKAIDDLSALESPEALKDIQSAYVEGCNDLKDSLNLYIDLLSEIENATEADPFDYSSYDARLQEIKDKYDSGIAALGDGDTKATEKQ